VRHISRVSSFSSLYIGILAATRKIGSSTIPDMVSVPFTSGSSLQLKFCLIPGILAECFSSLYIGILAATHTFQSGECEGFLFQFPLHRDPRCNSNRELYDLIQETARFSSLYIGILAATQPPPATQGVVWFQFPLHRDPRCNKVHVEEGCGEIRVSVPFTSGSSLQPKSTTSPARGPVCFSSLYIGILAATYHFLTRNEKTKFQFPLHRDPRCNATRARDRYVLPTRFSSLYIGILAATLYRNVTHPTPPRVSVPFTSGSSLQQEDFKMKRMEVKVSVPFTSGSSLQHGK